MDTFLLNKNRGVVLYRQLANVLRQHFSESRLSIGARIPTEFELSRTFGVSRGTVRQALGLLQKEGLIDRVPGLGTFISAQEASPAPSPSLRRIGLVIPYAQDQLSLNILIGAESVAKRRGYQLVFNHTNENQDQEKEDVARMRRDQVTGVIIFPISNQVENEMVWQLHNEHFPFVLVDRYFPGLNCRYVVADNIGGAYRATEHLIILGHTQIAFLYHPNADFRTTSVHDRYLGYRKALKEYNIEFDERWAVQLEDRGLIPRTDEQNDPYHNFLTCPDRPRAVFAVNDTTAVDLLTSAIRLGISIPVDLAIVGFDNLRIASQVPVPLTTVNVLRTQIGEAAAHLLIDCIEGIASEKPVQIVLPSELIVRESCGARQRIRQNRLEIDQAS